MTPDFVTLTVAISIVRSQAHSALPDAPVISEFIAPRPERAPRLSTLRKRMAGAIWPGELGNRSIEQTAPATGC